jgi:hypothetical protein
MVSLNKTPWSGDGQVVPLAKYIEASRKLELDDIDWDRVTDWPLEEDAVAGLTYMADIEGYTIAYMRDLLNTAAIDDADIARFMTLWAYEELFHEEGIQRFLGCYGVKFEKNRGVKLRPRRAAWTGCS